MGVLIEVCGKIEGERLATDSLILDAYTPSTPPG